MNRFDIQQDKITETACVTCIWDADGIWVDLNYAHDTEMGPSSSQICFASLWTDSEDNWPSEALWKEAIKTAKMISKVYNLPLEISDENQG